MNGGGQGRRVRRSTMESHLCAVQSGTWRAFMHHPWEWPAGPVACRDRGRDRRYTPRPGAPGSVSSLRRGRGFPGLAGPGAPGMAAWNNLGAVVRALGDPARAEPIYRNVLGGMELIYGTNHPSVGKAASNLAILLSQDGRPAEARHLALRAVVIAERTFGYNHIEVATKLASLGTILFSWVKLARGAEFTVVL